MESAKFAVKSTIGDYGLTALLLWESTGKISVLASLQLTASPGKILRTYGLVADSLCTILLKPIIVKWLIFRPTSGILGFRKVTVVGSALALSFLVSCETVLFLWST